MATPTPLRAALAAAAALALACSGTPPSLPDDALGDTTVGASYSHTIQASGGTAPLKFSATGVPTGLTLASDTGLLSGTAATSGDTRIVVTVTDADGASAVREFPFKVYDAPGLANEQLADAEVGLAYQQALQVTGGKPPLTLELGAGELPSGLALQKEPAAIAGTPASPGKATLGLRITDANGASATKSFGLTVFPKLAVATASLPEGEARVAYGADLSITGGKAPVTVTVGGLPAGLSFDPATLRISGTSQQAASATLAVQATDALGAKATASLPLQIVKPVAVQTALLADAYVGLPYSQQLAAEDGIGPYTWANSGSPLPAGLALSAGGLLSGSPSAQTNATVAVSVTDAVGGSASRQLPLAVLVQPAVATSSLPDAYVGVGYSQTLSATGGRAPYTWAAQSLPGGLGLSEAGELAGVPAAGFNGTVTVEVTDGNGKKAGRGLSLRIWALPVVSSEPLPDAYVGSAYSATLTASGGKAPYAFAADGPLPAGLALASTGVLSGTPTGAPGTPAFKVKVTDAGGQEGSATLTLPLYAAPGIAGPNPLPAAVEGVSYKAQVNASGGKAPLTWSATGLPTGLSINPATGLVAGIPAQGTASAASYGAGITVKDANGKQALAALSLAVRAAAPIPGGGTAYPGVTDSMTVFVVDRFDRPLAGAGVRIRRNGQEYSPIKQALTSATGKVFFSGLGGGAGDTYDVTVTVANSRVTTLANFNAQLFTEVSGALAVPVRRTAAVAAANPATGSVVVFGGAGEPAANYSQVDSEILYDDTAAFRGGAWQELVHAGMPGSPGPVRDAAAAWVGGGMVVYGGSTGTPAVHKFVESGNAWSKLKDGPPARTRARLVAISATQALLFGGSLFGATPAVTNELWRYDSASDAWTRLTPAGAVPAARARHGLAWIPQRARMLLFGGEGAGGEALKDTWEYDPAANSWLQVTTASANSMVARKAMQLADDGANGALLFGGEDDTHSHNDLWFYDGVSRSWTRWLADFAANSPDYRVDGVFVHVPSSTKTLLFGGNFAEAFHQGSWLFDSGTRQWSYVPTGGVLEPPRRLLSGTISGAVANSYVMVEVATPSGHTEQRWYSYGTSPVSYGFNVPSGEPVSVMATNWHATAGFPDDLLNFVDAGEAAEGTGSASLYISFPSQKAVPKALQGVRTLPQGWGTADSEGVQVRLRRPGYQTDHFLGYGQIAGNGAYQARFFQQPGQWALFWAQSKAACGTSAVAIDSPSGTLDAELPALSQGLAPGASECAGGTVPVATEGAKTFVSPAWADVIQLGMGPVGGIAEWIYVGYNQAGPASVNWPQPSTLVPAPALPSGQRVQWMLHAGKSSAADLDDAPYSSAFRFTRAARSGLMRYQRP